MNLAFDGYVDQNVVLDAYREFMFAIADERPLSNLEQLGWLVLGSNMGEVIALTAKQRAFENRNGRDA